jgi:hypothetical protein
VAQPKKIDFYRCTRPMQDRFVASTRRSSPPVPLLFKPAPRTTAWVLIGASAVLASVATVALAAGWGDVTSPLALHRTPLLAVDVLLLSAAAYCFIHATIVLRAMEALPYRAGTYLFPACVIDATDSTLRVWAVADAQTIATVDGPALVLAMRDGERVIVPGSSAEEVERAKASLESLRPGLLGAIEADNTDMLAELDPLHHTRMSSPILSTEGMKRFSPWWSRLDGLPAIAVGVALGLGLGSMRNASSDQRMYEGVVAAGSVPLYEEYLRRGGRRSDEIREEYLARAELAEAQKKGTLDALQEYVREHPTTKIGSEVDDAMRRALLVELEKAKAAGTVAAIDDFAKAFPSHQVDAEIQAARHAVYARALAAWRQKNAQVDAATAGFVERLLAQAEKNGPACDVRFRFLGSKTMDDMDKRVMKHAYYPGSDALPSHYLTADAMRPREDRVAQAIADAFTAAFPADVLAMHAGEELAADAPNPTKPATLVLEYAVESTNALTASMKPRTILTAVRFDFDAKFALLEKAPWQTTLKSLRGPEIWKIKANGITLEDFHRKAYDGIIDGAFGDWQKKVLDAFFR